MHKKKKLFLWFCEQACNLCQHFDAHQVHEADACQVEDEGVEGHGLGLQRDGGGTGWLSVRRPLAQLNVTTVEVDIAGGRLGFAGAAVVHVKVILQLKLRYGLDLEGIRRERCRGKVTGFIFRLLSGKYS